MCECLQHCVFSRLLLLVFRSREIESTNQKFLYVPFQKVRRKWTRESRLSSQNASRSRPRPKTFDNDCDDFRYIIIYVWADAVHFFLMHIFTQVLESEFYIVGSFFVCRLLLPFGRMHPGVVWLNIYLFGGTLSQRGVYNSAWSLSHNKYFLLTADWFWYVYLHCISNQSESQQNKKLFASDKRCTAPYENK